ncbi:MAG: 50S ribosomal protein L24 [Actinomycetes bacterium]|jgi:large subunit ribosomal protein L24|nr:MAG: 50S ribosomal protein L24 [Actinomycetota bacterium]
MPPKLHVKKGDYVQVIAGKDKGAKGRIIAAYPREQRVVVEGVNMITKHSKVTHQGPRAGQGGVRRMEAPIHASNVKKLKEEPPKKDDDKPAKKTSKSEADESGEDS